MSKKYSMLTLNIMFAGNYQPNWFMKNQHVHPGEALEINKDVASKKSLGIYWGTFKMSSTYNNMEPPALLRTLLTRSGLDSSGFVTTDIGWEVTEYLLVILTQYFLHLVVHKIIFHSCLCSLF